MATGDFFDAEVVEKASENDFVAKTFARDPQGGAPLTRVVHFNRSSRSQDLFHVGKGKQPLPGRQEITEASFLCDHRPARGKVSNSPIAEPTAPQAKVLIFRHG